MAKIRGHNVVLFATAEKPEQTKSVTITENGTTAVTPDSGKTLSSVEVTVSIPEYNGEVQ